MTHSTIFLTFLIIFITAETNAAVTSLLEFRQRNVVMQEWDLSCGAAALTILLRYQHGLDITEKEVALELIGRQEYQDNPDLLRIKQGFSLLDLKRYVDKRGLAGDGFGNLNFDNLIEMAPVLVPVDINGYNHFVVFRGVAGNRVLMADPAWGNRIMSRLEFENAWLNIGDIGKVGFTVTSTIVSRQVYGEAENRLLPTDLDFVMLR